MLAKTIEDNIDFTNVFIMYKNNQKCEYKKLIYLVYL